MCVFAAVCIQRRSGGAKADIARKPQVEVDMDKL